MKEIIQILLFIIALIIITPVMGRFMAKVFMGEKHFLMPLFGWLERLIYRIIRVDKQDEMNWKAYLFGLLVFNFLGFLFVFVLQMVQAYLPLNPQHLPNVPWHLSFNTAVSFVTNTNWQSYAGETTMGNLVQMLGLAVQNFVSAATGIAVAILIMRGITRKTTENLGNFWIDITRCIVYILIPISFVFALILVGQGVVQSFSPNITSTTLQGMHQVIPMGPAASQISIKMLGTNGGGFFNANAAHPFENPTPFSNFIQMLSIFLIPAGLTFTYGRFAGSNRQGWTIFIVMFLMFIIGLGLSLYAEYGYNSVLNVTGNMEGKETRFGVANSVLFSVVTTDASCGAVNAMHDSLTPLSGMVILFNMMLGEVIFGGVGAGLYGMVLFIILTVFIAGLMVGRTPELLGKKIEAFEVKMAIIGMLAPNIVIKLFTALACLVGPGLAGLNNNGPHGLSEILYAFTSAAANNGSAFAGLNTNTVFYNLLLGLGMIIGRFGIIVPVIAIAGSMAKKKVTPASLGTFRTDNWLFVGLLIGVILIIGGLTFFPPMAFGPIIEHFLMNAGSAF
jgi:potassium-transporting ATPase potassium-binding subunit